MNRILIATVTAGLLATMTLPAQTIKQREKIQQKRIAQGVNSGELTGKETVKLEKREANLDAQIKKDRLDGGGLTPQERHKIRHKQNQLSRKVYKEKHDNQTQPGK